MVSSARAFRRVFLSHSSQDKADIQRLRLALADRGIGVWEDVLELRLGDSLDALKAAVLGADGFVLLLTPEAISSDWVSPFKVVRRGNATRNILRRLIRVMFKWSVF